MKPRGCLLQALVTSPCHLRFKAGFTQREQYPLIKVYSAFKGSFQGCIGFGVYGILIPLN